ncbi:hypothetical protein [Listeria booriae]|uniref:hypothetical protein n=1 Tax=Listeria booriae TaxID=1552123 RepID=UPI001624E81C|nr:hypothetical protein [Listeria booriae]MBC2106151.1 hypothetical protein [Listeria booriae]
MITKNITLKDGTEVKIDPSLSLAAIRRAKNEGLLSKRFLNDLMAAENNPDKMNFDDMENAVYLAFRNANPTSAYTREQFEDLWTYNIQTAGEVYTAMLSGEIKNNEMQHAFKKAAGKSKKPKGKRYHN